MLEAVGRAVAELVAETVVVTRYRAERVSQFLGVLDDEERC